MSEPLTDADGTIDLSRPVGALVIGRAGMDLYPVDDGGKIADAAGFTTDISGSAGNIAVALVRAGASAGLVGAVSDDPIGRFVLMRLQTLGVDTASVATVGGDPRTSLALAEVRPVDCEVTIYRNNAADLQWKADERILQRLPDAAVLIVTGTALVAEPSRSATLAMMSAAAAAGTRVIFDLDYRAYSWRSQDETVAIYGQAIDVSHVVVGNEEEFSVLSANHDGRDAAEAIAAGRGREVILKLGEHGSDFFAAADRFHTPVFPVKPMKPYGAGDAFLGNLVATRLAAAPWRDAIRRGAAAAAMVVSRRGCASAMPNADELDAFLADYAADKSAATDAER
jgi:5-dehydro-2-deoxygluconokinase